MIHIVGHTAIDHISKVAHLPEKNCSTHITDRQIYYGGGAANIAAGIAMLGEKVTLHSCVGSDFKGSDYDRWMTKLGVGQQFFIVPDAHTPTAFMFTDETGDQMTFFEWGASRAFRTSEAPALPLVHMATADPEFNCRVADKGEFVSFDPGQDVFWYNKEQLDSIISNADILFANQHEVKQMCETLGITRDALIARVGMAIFTMSGDGSTLYTKGKEHFIPVVPVTLADPTGAGDSYRAGFLSAYVREYDPLTCCKIGTVTASHVVEHVGCQTHLPTWDTMEARYKKNFGELPAPKQ
ncbi:carbohydrate kinase family protein [Methanoregula formicica]|uniref:Sugar kinase, ribokinase n=1 Tax=Methanoregula formicica (strain DSM 22288 / NBRC 105244 / SMSP) TaxID=593750 RepID=L0HF99_METFS|nr:carbohydrate kinase family protein [Methanoregula formicica]AGB03417.1 sugar kinase, ribokinase [Methanoregula formicica SMSP]